MKGLFQCPPKLLPLQGALLTAIIPRVMPWARSFWAFSPYLNHMRKFCCLFVKVLSFLLSLASKLDGVMRTMVIAGKAGEAILVM